MDSKLLFIFTVCYSFLITLGFELHKRPTKREAETLLKNNYYQTVGDEYENIDFEYSHKLQKGDYVDESINFNAVYQKYDFYLKRNDHSLIGKRTPMFLARINDEDGSIVYDRYKYPIDKKKFKSFRTRSKRADFMAHANDDDDDYFATKQNNKTDGTYNSTKTRWNLNENTSNDPFVNLHHLHKRALSHNNNIKIVYPEVLVVVSNEIYEAHNRNLVELATYIAGFWNGVDLMFRQMKNPEVRLNIAGLVVNTDERVETYLDFFKESLETNKFAKDLLSFNKNVGNIFCNIDQPATVLGPKPKDVPCYGDITVVLISYPIVKSFTNNQLLGLSEVAGACKTADSVALVTDYGGFEGILSATHELGHLFGAKHDGEGSKYIPGGCCYASDGFIMGEPLKSKNNGHWSHCSIFDIQNYLRSNDAKCLRNKPNIGKPRKLKLPGQILNRDQQCGRRGFGLVSLTDDCNELNCLTEGYLFSENLNSMVETMYFPAAEGTPCGNKGICLKGTCVEVTKHHWSRCDKNSPTYNPTKCEELR